MKRVASVLLSAVLAIGMTMAAFAANPKIVDQTAALADMEVGERGPGYKIWLPLTKDLFDGATEDLTMSDVKSSKITVKQTASSGSKAIGSVEIKEGAGKVASVLVTLQDPYTSTKPLDFDLTLTLHINGKRQDFQTRVMGTLVNEEEIIYSDTDYVDLSDGRTAKCEESARKVEAYLGSDVSIYINMIKGKEYYGTVSREPDADDDEILESYPEIEEVYALTTIGLNASGNNVKLNTEGEYYVYSKNLEYLGTTGDMLPYSTRYYLTSVELDIDAATAEPEDSDDSDDSAEEPEDEPEEGIVSPDVKHDVAPSDTNTQKKVNPDTGLGSMFFVAIAAGALSLTAMTAISLGRKK